MGSIKAVKGNKQKGKRKKKPTSDITQNLSNSEVELNDYKNQFNPQITSDEDTKPNLENIDETSSKESIQKSDIITHDEFGLTNEFLAAVKISSPDVAEKYEELERDNSDAPVSFYEVFLKSRGIPDYNSSDEESNSEDTVD